ncbi:CorA family divalent cation transporter [Arthrobacter liuii]|uniref:Uncharacterized protein n=1 Tax=Arthrobacter liuii TaxID=1476996 RepID=A0ABQ2AYP8_9MICC|nr:hypothetical protein GCM10007170_44500 [Arthrobacter liuii]
MNPAQLTAHWDAEPDLTRHGASFLLWGLLDLIVDGHFDTVQELDSRIDALEDVLFYDEAPDHNPQRRSFELRKSLVQLRRAVLPMHEVLNTLLRRDRRHRFLRPERPVPRLPVTTGPPALPWTDHHRLGRALTEPQKEGMDLTQP